MSLSIGVLSWKAHKTLRNTLESYKLFGLDKIADQKIIFFQEIKQPDIDIAVKYGYKYIGDSNNIGIAAAYKRLVEYSTSDLFLFLENDWVLLEKPDSEIYDAMLMLISNQIDVARFRHRKFPGSPLWTLQFKGFEWDSPQHLLDCVHWTKDPDLDFPDQIQKNLLGWYVTTAQFGNWTNNPTMFRTQWLRDYILPHIGERDIEVDLQSWWQTQSFIVAQKNGLFTHNRIG